MDRGTIDRLPSGKWRARVSVKGADGKRKRLTKTHATKADAQRWVTAELGKLDTGSTPTVSTITVGEYLDRWLTDTAPQLVRPNTLTTYTTEVRTNVAPYLGHVKLQALTAAQVQGWVARLSTEGGRSGDGLSPKSVRNAWAVLQSALGHAVAEGLLMRNPAALRGRGGGAVVLPRIVKKAPEAWTPEEVETFLGSLTEPLDAALYRLAVSTGMRRSEMLGLRWSDLDLDAATLTVARAVVLVGSTVEVGAPKTATSARTISLDAATVEELRRWRSHLAGISLPLARAEAWVFPNLSGDPAEPMKPDTATRRFTAAIRELPVSRLTLHGLRHTWATLALRSGVAPKVVQERLGHSSITTTMDIYTHVQPETAASAAQQVADLWGHSGSR